MTLPLKETAFHSQTGFYDLRSREGSLFLKQYGETAPYSEEEAAHLIAMTRRFVAIAKDVGVPLPRTYMIRKVPQQGARGLYTISTATETCGEDMKKVIEEGNVNESEIIQILQSYLIPFARVKEAGNPISLDPPLANFCERGDGSLRFNYVDLFPPRQKLDDGSTLVEWPNTSEEDLFMYDRYFTEKQGVAIYAQILRTLAAAPSAPPQEAVLDLIGCALGDSVYNQVQVARQVALDTTDPTHCDALRIVAGERCLSGDLTLARMKDVYASTHIAPGGILPSPEAIQDATRVLTIS